MRTVMLMLLGTIAWLAIPEEGFAQYRGGVYYRGGPGFYGRGFYGPYYRGGFYPYYGGGFGYGFGYGLGVGIYASPWMYAYPSVRVVASPPNGVIPPQGTTAEPPPVGETGLKIVSVAEKGSADKALMRVGDTILSVGTTRVRTLNDLRAALSAVNNGDTEIVFINPENGKREKLPVKVVEGRIGVNVEQVDLK